MTEIPVATPTASTTPRPTSRPNRTAAEAVVAEATPAVADALVVPPSSQGTAGIAGNQDTVQQSARSLDTVDLGGARDHAATNVLLVLVSP